MPTPTLRRLLALSPMLVLVACAPNGVRPRSEPRVGTPETAHCVRRPLEDGRDVCLSSAPLSGLGTGTSRAALSDGVTVEELVDPTDLDTLPSHVDLRETLAGCLEVRDQGECGWCAGHTGAEVLDALVCAEGCGPARSSVPHLWSVGRDGPIGDCGPGMMLSTALRAATGDRLVPESVWPFAGGRRGMESTRPSDAELAMQGRYRAQDAVIIRDQPPGSGPTASQLHRVRAALASGRAVGVTSGVCWDQGWGAPDYGREVVDAPTGACATTPDGYHAWVLVGYDDASGDYIGLNSWGTSWGHGGYFRMTRAFVEQQLSGAGYLTDLDREAAQCSTETTPSCQDVTDCAQCTQTTGCAFCNGECVPTNDDGSAPAECIRSRPLCPAPAGACSAHTDCGSCAADDGCAWCGASRRCVGWPENARACNGERVATAADQCNDATRACEQQTDCASCQAMVGCGWCGSPLRNIHASGSEPCVGGDSDHSDRASCDDAWAPSGSMCPATGDAGVADASSPTTMPPDAGLCSPAGDTCTSDTCCGSLVCRTGACCALPSSPCETAADCCDGVACEGGTCQCIPTGGACSDTVLCCGSNVCRGGTCQAP